jgi:Flagellar transcriptional activator (FlhC)
MRISDNRYSRDRQRYDLALRFIQHEARTSTIRMWTGLTDDRIRKLYRSYIADDGHSTITRHRGKSPQHIGFFTRTPHMRQETAVLASVCYLLGVMPSNARSVATKMLPAMQRGESLCEAFEAYNHLVSSPRISFEHAVFLVTALANGEELRAELCADCTGLIVVDRFAMNGRRCLACEDSRQGRLPLD